jgi:hypothetical protein
VTESPDASLDELDRLLAERGARPSAQLDERLLELRRAGVAELAERTSTRPTKDQSSGSNGTHTTLPEVDRSGLDAATLGRALSHNGALLVRGLLDQSQVSWSRANIDAVEAEAEQGADQNIQVPDRASRLEDLLAMYRAIGLHDVLEGYLGARPVILAERTRLHRDRAGLPWHQDAAFFRGVLGPVNVWVALTPAGVDRPGLEVIPRTFGQVFGTEGGTYPGLDYGAGLDRDFIDGIAGDHHPVTPVFEPGDALLFDDMTMHRTHVTPAMDRLRDVLVCWFFAPDRLPEISYPTYWTPLVF